MPKQIYIQIPKPCHENWNEMTPTTQGAFCKSCRKNVIDFTNKTENEIYETVVNSKSDMCGRFTQFQLEQPVRKTELKNGFMNWKAIAASLAAVFSFGKLASAADTESKPKTAYVAKLDTSVIVRADKQTSVTGSLRYKDLGPKIDSIDQGINGNVIDAETREGLPFVAVCFKHGGIVTGTDENGTFSLIIDKEKYKNDTLVFRAVGYETNEIPVTKFRKDIPVELKSPPMTVWAGMMVITKKLDPLENGEDLLHGDHTPRKNFRNQGVEGRKRKE